MREEPDVPIKRLEHRESWSLERKCNSRTKSLHPTEVKRETMLLIVLIILLLVFGFGGYRLGPGIGYYGGGGISLILFVLIILLLLKVI